MTSNKTCGELTTTTTKKGYRLTEGKLLFYKMWRQTFKKRFFVINSKLIKKTSKMIAEKKRG